jgi:hypothetical protein
LGVDAGGAAESCTDYMEEPAGNGLFAKTAANTATSRTITGTSNEIAVTNGDGAAGNPTLSLPATLDLSGKATTIQDNNLTLQDNLDTTKKAQLQLSGITTGSTRTLTIPDATGTIALTSSNVATATALAANGANCAAGQAPLGVDDGGSAEFCTDYVEEPASAGMIAKTAANTTAARAITGTSNEITVTNGDGASGNPTLSISSTFDLSSKTTTLQDDNLTIQDNADASKKVQLQLSGLTTATTRTLTVPDATGTLALTSSNVATASALASNGANCAAGEFPLGVDAAGASEACTALPTSISGTTNEIAASAATGAVTLSIPSTLNLASKTLRIPNSTTLPATCTVGDLYMDTDATSGQRLYLCQQANTWALQGDGGGAGASSAGSITAVQAADGGGGFADSGCTANAGDMACDSFTGAVVGNVAGDVTGNVTGDVTGNASTATALAANPSDCAADNFATTIDASGNLTCAKPSISGGVSGLGANVATFLGTPSSANLAAALTNETGSGAAVFGTSPTIDAPIITTTINLPSVTALPGSPVEGDVVIVTDDSAVGACDSAAGSAKTACRYNGVTWEAIGDGSAGSTPTLDQAFDSGKVIDGANSLANAVRIGDGSTPICLYTDATAGPQVRPCTDANIQTRIPANFTWALYDEEGTAPIETVDPDAATQLGKWSYGAAYRPKKSIWFDAAALSTDGTQCAAPAEVTINSGPKTYTVICTENDAASMYGKVKMPTSWDGGTITLTASYIQTAADTGSMKLDVTAQCRGNGEAPSSTWGTEQDLDDAAVTGSNQNDFTTSPAITPAGTCAGGDMLYIRAQVDATGNPTTAAATLHFLGFTMEYTITSRSD